MTLFLHELKRGRLPLIIWTAALSYMLLICIIIYPLMAEAMEDMSEMFASMGEFSEAFGMDQLGVGDFLGYFAVECGEVMGMGGAVFAAILGIAALSKEEKDKTAEFLLVHPVKRESIVLSKLLSVMVQIVILNAVVFAVTSASVILIGEDIEWKKLILVMLSYFLLQVEIAGITFGISAFIRSKGFGIGIGLSLGLYFISLIANMTEELEFLRWVTPFTYTDGAYIVENAALDIKFLALGAALTAAGIAAAFLKYRRKDIL